jgi:hypothetical protein
MPSGWGDDVVDRVDEQRRLANAIRHQAEQHSKEQRQENAKCGWLLYLFTWALAIGIVGGAVYMAITSKRCEGEHHHQGR